MIILLSKIEIESPRRDFEKNHCIHFIGYKKEVIAEQAFLFDESPDLYPYIKS